MTIREHATQSSWRVEPLDAVGSTNQELLTRVDRELATPGQVLIAREQVAGKGRQGRTWRSSPGGLYMSSLIEDREGWGSRWALVVGLAVHQAVASAVPTAADHLALKWPNDVMLHDRKLCGILIERAGLHEPWWLVLGTGVNIVPPTEPAANASYLCDYRPSLTPELLAPAILDAVDSLRNQFAKVGPDAIRRAWLAHAWHLGDRVSCHLNGERLSGVFKDLDADGAMILERDDGTTQRISGGEVHFGVSPNPGEGKA